MCLSYRLMVCYDFDAVLYVGEAPSSNCGARTGRLQNAIGAQRATLATSSTPRSRRMQSAPCLSPASFFIKVTVLPPPPPVPTAAAVFSLEEFLDTMWPMQGRRTRKTQPQQSTTRVCSQQCCKPGDRRLPCLMLILGLCSSQHSVHHLQNHFH